uniref:Expansin-like EG45 domain-containing protein n=1 Tax=Leersia perrieri TaxID=77586 RepID=A0A0D9XEQ6_9ORYZ
MTMMPQMTSVVMATVIGLAMVSLVAGISGTATFYTPPYILVMVIVASLAMISLVAGTSGTATFYTPPYTPSACTGFQDEGPQIAAASDAFWGGGAACGKRLAVTCTGATNQGVPQPCTGQTVTVKVVDYCPTGSCRATIDLSQEAFAAIANPDAGKILVEYHEV